MITCFIRNATVYLLCAAGMSVLAQTPSGPGEYAVASQQSKKSGLPVLVALTGKKEGVPTALNDPKSIVVVKPYLRVTLPAESNAAKKLNGTPGGLVFVDGEGTVLGRLEPGFTSEQLVERTAEVAEVARGKALAVVADESASATTQLAHLESALRLGASVQETIPFLAHKRSDVKAAARKSLAGRVAEGGDWLLLDAMASPDADLRVAAHPLAVELTKATKVPPAKFWREASEEDRAAALDKWREAVYGKLPAVNRKIVEYTVGQYGKKVSSGECSELAEAAIKVAGARQMVKDGNTYIWGRPLGPNEPALPGDVVQLEDAKFDYMTAPHHTQIVRRVMGKGQYEVLEQNSNGRRTVGVGKLDLNRLKQGTVVIYRPTPVEEPK